MGGGLGLVFELIGETGGGLGAGFGLDDGSAGGGDALDGGGGLFVGFGLEQIGELGEGEGVEAAEIEGGDGWVGEVFEEGVGEGRGGMGRSKTPSVRFADTSPGGPGEASKRM